METSKGTFKLKERRKSAFTLIEAVVAAAIVGIVFVSLYAGIASGFYSIQYARENLRATQIMMEKMEVIRVLTWSQINSNGFLPLTFSAPYDPNPQGNSGKGAIYTGTIKIEPTPLSTSYAGDLRRVHVKVSWKSREQTRVRELETYYSKYGVQNYLFQE